MILTRRTAMRMGAAGAGGLLLSGCDALNDSAPFKDGLANVGRLHELTQRAIIGDSPAREFTEAEMSPGFKANGTLRVADPAYRALLAGGFSQWALRVDGLVHRPLDLSLPALQTMPQRTQITRHDCVEGWSAIGKWQGPQLGAILSTARLMPGARYVVFHCADQLEGKPFYESIDLIEAFHPQTILAWRMNDALLTERHGAPIRLRVERQLGYKHAKYLMRIELRESLAGLYGGKGGFWEDNRGYQWWAGI